MICFEKAKFKGINVDICCFNMNGITNNQKEKGQKERQKVLTDLFTSKELETMGKRSWFHKNIVRVCKGIIRRFWKFYASYFKQYKYL